MGKVAKQKTDLSKGSSCDGKKRKLSSKGVRVGGICPLDLEVPYGLFEGFDGDWYLISNNEECKLAIVLAHSELPSFTVLRLKPHPLTGGRWWGDFHVAAGVPIDDVDSTEVGVMSGEGWPKLSLQCHTRLVYTQWLAVGRVTALREDFDRPRMDELGSEYHSWTIIRAHDDRPILSRLEDGTVGLARRVAPEDCVTHIRVKPCRN